MQASVFYITPLSHHGMVQKYPKLYLLYSLVLTLRGGFIYRGFNVGFKYGVGGQV
jgi:hypothetical protein